MPEYTRPNLEIPTVLWGEVKVAAFRRGCKPVEVVVGLLEKEFGGSEVTARGDGTGRNREGGSTPPPPTKASPSPVSEPLKVVVVDRQTDGYTEVIRPMKKCAKCFDQFPVADMVTEPKSGKLYCQDCVDNMKNNQ